jgi:hypothetical protein
MADFVLGGLAALTTPSRRLHGTDRAGCAREQVVWGLGVEMGEKNGRSFKLFDGFCVVGAGRSGRVVGEEE